MNGKDSDALSLYLKEIDNISPLPKEEEIILKDRILFAKGAQQIKLRNTLVEHNLRFVVSEAKKHQNRGVSLKDLIAVGNWGMVKASIRFDYSMCTKFISYAVWWVRMAIYGALEDSFLFYSILSDIPLEETHGILPNDETIGDRFFRRDFSRAFDSAASDNLSDRETTILTLYFGLDNEGPFTLDDLAGMIGVTRERVRQIKRRAIEKLSGAKPEGLVQIIKN